MVNPLTAGYGLGVALRHAAYRSGWLKTRKLTHPVISVGNLTVGGTGKTPLVAWIAERLSSRGWKPCILTRGYGRRRGQDYVVLEPGSLRQLDPREVGDEPAWLARALPDIPMVIGAERYHGGRLAEERFEVTVHLLDDGFQHLALARDVDVVLLDVTQEFSNGALLPTGRLREPCAAIRRAHLVVLARMELGDAADLERRVRELNPQAEIFHGSTKLRALKDANSDESVDLEGIAGKPVYAFCGIGNPKAFFSDLQQWGLTLVGKMSFRDHHVYSGDELERLIKLAREARATALVSTEKDAMNFPMELPIGLPFLVCGIQAEIQEAEAFENTLLARLEAAKAKAR